MLASFGGCMTTVRYFEEGIIRCPVHNKFVRNSCCNDCEWLDSIERDRLYCGYGEVDDYDYGGE